MKISIIIPTCYRTKELQDCLISLKSQSVKPDEIIIIGDTNDKETEEFVFKSNFNYLNLIYLKSDGGTCKKRNMGIEKSKGEVIVFLDDDVILPKDYIKNTKEIFTNTHINLITGHLLDAKGLTNPLFIRKSDIRYLLKNQDDEFVKLIKEKIFPNSKIKYYLRSSFIKKFRFLVKSLFILEHPIKKGWILSSGYRSEMPPINTIKKLEKVGWIYGGNFAARRAVFRIFQFNEDLEKYPYALNEDLEFSARVGKKYDIYITPDMLLLHLRSPGRKIKRRERFECMILSTNIIAQERGNMVAHRWSIYGLLFNSIIRLPFDKSVMEEIEGIISGKRKIRKLNKKND